MSTSRSFHHRNWQPIEGTQFWAEAWSFQLPDQNKGRHSEKVRRKMESIGKQRGRPDLVRSWTLNSYLWYWYNTRTLRWKAHNLLVTEQSVSYNLLDSTQSVDLLVRLDSTTVDSDWIESISLSLARVISSTLPPKRKWEWSWTLSLLRISVNEVVIMP